MPEDARMRPRGRLRPARLVRALRDGAVPLRLVRDRGCRAAQVVRHGLRAFVLVERPLYCGSLRPVELEVLPLFLLCHALILSLAAGPLLARLRTRTHGFNRTRSTESDRKTKRSNQFANQP